MAACCPNGVDIKLFAGIPLKADLKLHLQQSADWKQNAIMPIEQREIIEIHYQGREYIGRFLTQKKPTLVDVQEVDDHVKKYLVKYCPDFELKEISVHIFPQVFVT